MDWSTVVVLAAVTWLDGWRRVPAGALVLRRALAGQWTVAERDAEPGVRLVAWWNPLTLALITPRGGISTADGPEQQSQDELAARLQRTNRVVGVLRALGALVIVAIVFGIPAAIARYDAWGLVASLGVVMLLSAVIAMTVSLTVRRAGLGWRRAARIGAPLLYPFVAPRGAEVVLLHAITGAAPLMVARQLLGGDSFTSWVRPHAYDALNGGANTMDSRALVALVGRPGLAQIVGEPPTHCGSGESYCPRCARVYRAETATCAECHGLPLTPHRTA